MFRPDPRVSFVPASREQVDVLVESLNQPQIQIPGRPAQAAAAHLCGLRNADGSRSVYVSLQLKATGDLVIYVREPHALTSAEAYAEAQGEGLAFLESMGFMLDDLQFRQLAPDAQAVLLARLPLFAAPRAAPPSTPATPEPAHASGPAAALSKLLANL